MPVWLFTCLPPSPVGKRYLSDVLESNRVGLSNEVPTIPLGILVNKGDGAAPTSLCRCKLSLIYDAATVLQPGQDASGQSRKTTARERLKTACICQISRQGSTYPESFDLTYKEGVAGSTPASPT